MEYISDIWFYVNLIESIKNNHDKKPKLKNRPYWVNVQVVISGQCSIHVQVGLRLEYLIQRWFLRFAKGDNVKRFFYEFNNVHPLEYHKCSHKSRQTRKIWTKKDKFIAKQTGVEKLREKRSNYQKINSGCIPLKENDQQFVSALAMTAEQGLHHGKTNQILVI